MIFTITGKSGSGKTFLANKIALFFDAQIISFDEISHQVLTKQDVINKIMQYFGDSVFDNNNLNRKKLGQIAFNDAKKLDFLNKLCQSKMEEIIDKFIDNQNQNFILEYALLPKMKYFKKSNCNILVKADLNDRKKRIVKRDNISEEYFLSRENNSLNYDDYNFDLIINNDENIDINQIVNQIKEVLCSEKQ